MTKWHKGPPPSIGWWPAKNRFDSNTIRWWNGKYWSLPAHAGTTAEVAGRVALVRGWSTEIEWADRPDDWPARSRT